MSDEKKTVLHLKENYEDSTCSKCKADLTDEGVYTFSENVYNDPPTGYRNCRSVWSE
jgi:NAD-dependent SIR2 family protein deacetylase